MGDSMMGETVFGGLTPIHCDGVAVVRKIGADLHIIYYQKQVAGDGQIVRRPKLYVVVPVTSVMEARKMADVELSNPISECDMRLLSEGKLQ